MIKVIDYKETWPIRQKVMWPDHPIEFSILENDPKGLHFGYYEDQKLIAVISLFIENDRAQFRKFATLQEYQGQGIGSQLLSYLIAYARENMVKTLWCNARQNKTTFYEKFGLIKTDKTFMKANQAYVIMERHL